MNEVLAAGANDAATRGMNLLDKIERAFIAGREPAFLMKELSIGLNGIRARMRPEDWLSFARSSQRHALASIVHQDPFTGWSFRKPRGYPGDAGLLDFIYEHTSVAPHVEAASDLGRGIYAFSKMTPAPVAVRERRDILADTVDRIAARQNRPVRVLAIAAGHLREAERSEAMQTGVVEQWVALDQDEASLAEVRRRFEGGPVRAITGSVSGLLHKKYGLGSFDLIYAAGLYDYLVPKVANRLTNAAFDLLNPGGTYLFANFTEDMADVGYTETFMDWHLILRSDDDMARIAASVYSPALAETTFYRGANGAIAYCELSKEA
ncbi:MAG: class I SAM-dependent methyltransferase [Pseudomonadota bacterium]